MAKGVDRRNDSFIGGTVFVERDGQVVPHYEPLSEEDADQIIATEIARGAQEASTPPEPLKRRQTATNAN